jgi:hypothetical protein
MMTAYISYHAARLRAMFVLYLCHVALSPVLVGGIDGQLSMLGDTPVHGSEDDVRMRRFTATEL